MMPRRRWGTRFYPETRMAGIGKGLSVLRGGFDGAEEPEIQEREEHAADCELEPHGRI